MSACGHQEDSSRNHLAETDARPLRPIRPYAMFLEVMCSTIGSDRQNMARPKGRQLPNRISVALTDGQFNALEGHARENQAALSWVIRRAVVEYLERNHHPIPADNVNQAPAPVAKD